MPSGIDVTERFASRRHSGLDTVEYLYKAEGSDDTSDIVEAVIGAAPTTHNSLIRQGVTDLTQEGNELWFATVSYGRTELGFEPDRTQIFGYDTTGGTQHITQSKETIASYGPDDDGTDHGGTIGVDSEGKNAAGVDIIAPVFNFTVRRILLTGEVSSGDITAIYQATGKVNNDSFTVTCDSGITITLAAGECLFLGASGGPISQSQWEIVFNFAGSPNFSGGSSDPIVIGDIEIASKNGWEYLWVQYGPEVDDDTESLALRPRYAYIERVYDSTAFSSLPFIE